MGCGGGLKDNGFRYYIEKGAMLGSEYPYRENTMICKYDPSKVVVGSSKFGAGSSKIRVVDYRDIPSLSGPGLERAVSGRVVSVGVDATNLKSYKGGVLRGEGCKG